jgi:aminoglycoside 2'-N-acetyltransferase I
VSIGRHFLAGCGPELSGTERTVDATRERSTRPLSTNRPENEERAMLAHDPTTMRLLVRDHQERLAADAERVYRRRVFRRRPRRGSLWYPVDAPALGCKRGRAAEGGRVRTTEVVVVATEDLTPAQRSSVIDVCIAAHDNDAFRNLFTFIPSGGRHFLGVEEAELVAHAVVTTRWAQPAGCSVLRTAFVDAVSTLPAHQGRGVGSAVMRRLAAEIDDYEIGCLQTDRASFYERLGWELWRGPLAGRRDGSLVPTPDQRGVMVLRLPSTPPLDLDQQLTIECQPDRIWE